MPSTSASTTDLPLPVRVFRAAMQQQLSLADYAQRLGISTDSLGAIVTAQLDQVEPAILDQLADVYQQSREALRDQLSIVPAQDSFAAWLKRNMEGISQHALRTRVQLDAKTLKQFLNGELLPDSDQAERLARALYIDRTELARVVTANMIHQVASGHRTATTRATGEQPPLSPTSATDPAPVRREPTRRQKPLPDADSPGAQGAAATGAAVVPPALEGEHARRRASRRQGATKTDDAVKGAVGEPEDRRPRRREVREQAGTKIAAQPPAPTAASSIEPAPVTTVKQPRRQAARRHAGTAAPDRETTAAHIAGAVTQQDNSATIATESAEHPAPEVLIAPATAPADTQRSQPQTASTTATPDPAAVASVLAADTATLQLTPDEVRLIRYWRQLHPHGRRATLHYIGSLLVEE